MDLSYQEFKGHYCVWLVGFIPLFAFGILEYQNGRNSALFFWTGGYLALRFIFCLFRSPPFLARIYSDRIELGITNRKIVSIPLAEILSVKKTWSGVLVKGFDKEYKLTNFPTIREIENFIYRLHELGVPDGDT